MTTLENTNIFCQALVTKYKQYYNDYYERFKEYLQDVTRTTELFTVNKLRYNYDQLLLVGSNLGQLEGTLDN